MNRSSTSSSEKPKNNPEGPPLRRGFPYAFVLSLVIIASVELVVRHYVNRGVLPYDTGQAEYHAIRNVIERRGPADVVFFGSSRGREGIVVPLIEEIVQAQLTKEFTFGNYSCAGGRASEVRAIMRHLLRWGKPNLVVYMVSPRQLCGTAQRDRQQALFWDRADWWNLYQMNTTRARELIPVMIRNELGRFYYTLRYRDFASSLIYVARYQKWPSSPPLGQYSIWHVDSPYDSRTERQVTIQEIEQYVANLMEDGKYLLATEKWQAMEDVIEMCRSRGTELVLVEVPVAEDLRRAYPAGTYETFYDQATALCARAGVDFVRWADYGVLLTDDDYRGPSHLNLRGAKLISQEIARQIIAPRLTAQAASASR